MSISDTFRDLPVAKLPCADCKHLKTPKSEKLAEHHMVCGWWMDENNFPIRNRWRTHSEGEMSIPRKAIFDGPFESENPAECPQFQPKNEA